MASIKTMTRASSLARMTVCSAHATSRRLIHQSNARHAITNLEMPAMSPTMTEGGIAGWKKREGEAFTAGDVLLEIETDKATIDVEAQDDGVMGKILLEDGAKNVPVGKVIALLAEEGDDISNLQPPKEEVKPAEKEAEPPKKAEASTSAPPPPAPAKPDPETSPKTSSHSHSVPSHSRPLFPSVQRLLMEHNVENPEDIKGTGVRGMLTKGDVLTFLGKASGPTGTYMQPSSLLPEMKQVAKKEQVKALDGPALRRLIVSTMLQTSLKARNTTSTPTAAADFDSIIADYLPSTPAAPAKAVTPTPTTSKSTSSYFDGLI